jgi:hypothetical protein
VKDHSRVHDLDDAIEVTSGPGLVIVSRPPGQSESLSVLGEESRKGGPIRLVRPLKQFADCEVGMFHQEKLFLIAMGAGRELCLPAPRPVAIGGGQENLKSLNAFGAMAV